MGFTNRDQWAFSTSVASGRIFQDILSFSQKYLLPSIMLLHRSRRLDSTTIMKEKFKQTKIIFRQLQLVPQLTLPNIIKSHSSQLKKI
jgi:hypothetical protein